MFLHKLFFLDVLNILFETVRIYFLVDAFENSLHVLVVVREGEFVQGDGFEFVSGAGFQRVFGVVLNHLVEVFEVGHWLKVLETKFGFLL